MMKRRDLVKALEDAGYISDGGTDHEKFKKDGVVVLLPRHKEIPDETAKRILRQAGIR